MRVGRVTRHWNRNCVAIGLSQGFIEPLEATALLFVQRTAALLVSALEKGDLGEKAQDAFNEEVNAQFEGTRDYIVTHYKTNTRTDTDYWRANAANMHLSEPLQRLLKTWLSRRPIIPGLQNNKFGQVIRRCPGTACWPAWDCSPMLRNFAHPTRRRRNTASRKSTT